MVVQIFNGFGIVLFLNAAYLLRVRLMPACSACIDLFIVIKKFITAFNWYSVYLNNELYYSCISSSMSSSTWRSVVKVSNYS